MTRAYRWLLPLMVVLGLASCSERMPSQPLVVVPGPVPAGSTPTDSSLAANQSRWSANGFDSYRYHFRWECYCVTDYVREVVITVVRGTIVSVVDAQTGVRLDDQATARYRTIDGLFDFVRESMNYPAHRIDVAFDSMRGYPLAAQVDYVALMVDEELGFRVWGLTPVRPR